jgi:hypothetical protein
MLHLGGVIIKNYSASVHHPAAVVLLHKLRFERNFRHGDAGFCALGRWASSGVALTQTKTHKEED